MELVWGLDIPSDSDFRVFYCMSCGSPTPFSPNDSVIAKSKAILSTFCINLSIIIPLIPMIEKWRHYRGNRPARKTKEIDVMYVKRVILEILHL